MALYMIVVYEDDGEPPSRVKGLIGPFGTEDEALSHGSYIRGKVNPAFAYDVYPLEFPT